MPDTRTKDADLAAIRARCELNYTVAGNPKFAGNQIVMAALANAKASEAAFLAAVAEADAARGLRIWSAYRHCRQACAAADSAHAALRATIEIAEQECDARSNNLPDNEALKTYGISAHFRGKPNTRAILEEKAEVAAHCIVNNFDWPLQLATTVRPDLHVGVEQARQALVETAAFLLSYIDQPAFLYLGAENRTVFMNALEGPIYYELRERGIELTAFTKLLNERYNEYGKILWLRDKGTHDFIWLKFGKAVALILGVGPNAAFQAFLENQLLGELYRCEIRTILRLPE